MAVAVIPVKSLATAKSRLAGVLTPDQRRRLVLAMLRNVLSACAASERLEGACVVTGDDEVADTAARFRRMGRRRTGRRGVECLGFRRDRCGA